MKYTYIYYKSTFSTILGYAISGHKAKGATISNKAIIKIENAFAPNLIKVMLTWIKKC